MRSATCLLARTRGAAALRAAPAGRARRDLVTRSPNIFNVSEILAVVRGACATPGTRLTRASVAPDARVQRPDVAQRAVVTAICKPAPPRRAAGTFARAQSSH